MSYVVRLRRASLALLVVSAIAIGDRAEALDPTRALTQYVHRIWQTQQGLPQASIDAVLQTSDGQLWLGTQTGLVRFDGVRFTSVDATSGVAMPDVWITALAEDGDHALWIGTDESGVYRLANGVLTRYMIAEGLPSTTVRCLIVDRSGRVWACTSGGLATWNGKRFEAFQPAASHPLGDVAAACVDEDARVWVAHDRNRLDSWSGRSYEDQPIALSKAGAIRSLMCADTGDVWVGTTDGLLAVSPTGQRRLTTADGLADNNILTIVQSRTGAVLVGTTNGFSRIRGRDIDSFRASNGLSQSAVYALFEDREGTLWAATGHGLNQFLDGRATPYTASEGLPSNNAGPVVQDRGGTIWAGTLDAGLARFDGHGFSSLTTRDGLASDTVLALADDHGALWVGTDRGLNRVRGGRVDLALTTASGLPSNVVRALRLDQAGTLWIATLGGAATYSRGIVTPIPGSAAPIVALGAGADGRPLLAPGDGPLEAYVDGRLTAVDDQLQALRNVDTIYTDPDGIAWVGTAGDGLLSIDRGRITKYTMRDGLFDDSIYAVLGDDHGRLWMACSKGIFSVERAQLLRVAAGQARKFGSAPYSPTDVLRTIECKPGIQPAAWRTSDGQLWFSTTRGLLVLDSRSVDRRFSPPAATVEEVTVNGARVASRADLGRLPPGENNVAFRYTGFSFVAPTRIAFKYRLEGFDAAWADAGARREAFYTNLPPGRFRFRVAACNPENDCREADVPVAFEVESRYYQRAWFIPLCIACAIGIAAVGVRLHIRRLRDQFALILAERTRIARELHDTLLQGFSGVTMEMQALSARLPGAERATLEQIVADAGASLREARQSLVSLRRGADRASDFASAIAQTSRQLTGERGIRLNLRLDDWSGALPADVEYNLLRIVQEAVLNAVKHSGTATLLVALERTAKHIQLLVKDDGSGFAGDDETRPGHYGLIGMRERAAQIGARLHLDTAPGRGTAVIVTMDA